MEKISFNKFKKETHHKKVIYAWFKSCGGVKEFRSDKFYINKCYKSKTLGMPKFLIGIEAEFYNHTTKGLYTAVFESGRVEFNVLN